MTISEKVKEAKDKYVERQHFYRSLGIPQQHDYPNCDVCGKEIRTSFVVLDHRLPDGDPIISFNACGSTCARKAVSVDSPHVREAVAT